MSSYEKSKSVVSETSSLFSTSSTASTVQLLKAKFSSKNKSSSKPVDTRSPGEKQAAKRAARINPATLAIYGSLK